MTINQILPPLIDKPYGGAWSIHDPESVKHLKNINHGIGDSKKFLNDYKEWICSGKNFKGLEDYTHIDFSAGTKETFGQFYFKHVNIYWPSFIVFSIKTIYFSYISVMQFVTYSNI